MSDYANKPLPQWMQFIAGFVIPTVILLTLSDESRFGPLYGMLLSLAFPVALEVYSLFTHRKAGLISMLAIIGILLIGVISLLGLSEHWLAVRRAAVYAVGALSLLILMRFRHQVINRALEQLFDMRRIAAAARRRGNEARLHRTVTVVIYGLAGALTVAAVGSYILTLVVMTAPTGSSMFNTEYAQLRLLSLPFITAPLVVVILGLIMYLFGRIERLTGIKPESFTKKRQ